MLTRARLWLRSIVLHARLEREMQEEMADHLDRATARLMARGLTADEARREARREFGNVAHLEEQAREARGAGWVEALAADVRFAWRRCVRTPLTTLTMFVVLTTGISISALLVSAVHSVAVQPPSGLPRDDDLVRIRGKQGVDGQRYRELSEAEVAGFRSLGGQFEGAAAWSRAYLALIVGGDAERRTQEARVSFVTENYFSVLGLRPVIGPGLAASDTDGAASAATAVIGHGTWEHLFGRDPRVIGSTVTLGGVPVTIVGVAPERFGIEPFAPIQLWMPLAAERDLRPAPSTSFSVVARLRPGVGLREASSAVRVVTDRVAATDDTLRALRPSSDVAPLLAMNSDPGFEENLRLLSVLVGLLASLVLLVTCTNVSALLMGLAAARRQEIAIRLSLGAARSRLVRQLLTESVLLAGAAGAAALAITWLALRALTRLVPLEFEIALTWPATTFTFGIALAVGVLFGLTPALHVTRGALAGALHDSAGTVALGRGRLQRGLVVAQIAFTQPLIALLATTLLIVLAELQPRRQTELGDRLINVRIRPKVSASNSSPGAVVAWEELRAANERVSERLRAMPGVEATVIEWRGRSVLGDYLVHPADRVAGAREDAVRLVGEPVTSGYLTVLGVPILRGRDFTPGEVAAATPPRDGAGVIIGADLAQRLWPGTDPVGRWLRPASDTTRGARGLTVVGVIDDPLASTRRRGEAFRIYVPPDTAARMPPALLLRTAGPASTLLPAVRSVVNEEAAGFLADVQTLAAIQDETLRNRRLAASGISAAGTMALLLSAIGLYAVVSFSVVQRTREIAVRMAVGASARRVARRFVADGVRLGVLGLALGLPVSLLGVKTLLAADNDFPVLPIGQVAAIAALGVIVTALVSAWIPARRAAAVDPAVTLRAE